MNPDLVQLLQEFFDTFGEAQRGILADYVRDAGYENLERTIRRSQVWRVDIWGAHPLVFYYYGTSRRAVSAVIERLRLRDSQEFRYYQGSQICTTMLTPSGQYCLFIGNTNPTQAWTLETYEELLKLWAWTQEVEQ